MTGGTTCRCDWFSHRAVTDNYLLALPADLEAQVRDEVRGSKEGHMPIPKSYFELAAEEDGRREGRKEAQQAHRASLLNYIEDMLAVRFPSNQQELLDEVRRQTDLGLLDRVSRAIRNAGSPDDIRSLLR